MTCGILVSDQGWNLHILQWKLGVLTAGLPGKSQLTSFERDQTVDATLLVQEGLPLRATPTLCNAIRWGECASPPLSLVL